MPRIQLDVGKVYCGICDCSADRCCKEQKCKTAVIHGDNAWESLFYESNREISKIELKNKLDWSGHCLNAPLMAFLYSCPPNF